MWDSRPIILNITYISPCTPFPYHQARYLSITTTPTTNQILLPWPPQNQMHTPWRFPYLLLRIPTTHNFLKTTPTVNFCRLCADLLPFRLWLRKTSARSLSVEGSAQISCHLDYGWGIPQLEVCLMKVVHRFPAI